MGGYDANEVLRTEGAEALRKALDAGRAKYSREDAVSALNRGFAELRGISRSDRLSRAPLIARRLSSFVAMGLLDKGRVLRELFQASGINNSGFRASIVSAIEVA